LIRKLPVDLRGQVVATGLPGRDGLLDLFKGIYSTVEALADENIQFNLGHVEPTAVFRGVNKLYAVADTFSIFGREGFVEGTRLVGAQVVKDQRDFSASS